MLRTHLSFFLFLWYTLFGHVAFAQQEVLGSWQFSNVRDSVWREAQVPGNIHTDLLRNKLIPDPFYGTQESRVSWVAQSTWQYRTFFKFRADQDSVRLCFDGLDTYAKIYVNHRLVLETRDMFLHYDVVLHRLMLDPEMNELRVVFTPVGEQDLQLRAQAGLTLPGAYAYGRKAAYHYGWDWGPTLRTCGIWKKVTLQYYTVPEVSHCVLRTDKVNPTEALMTLQLQLKIPTNQKYQIQVLDQTHGQSLFAGPIQGKAGKGGVPVTDTVSRAVVIPSPRLWWCRGYGEAFLYDIRVSISTADGNTIFDTLMKVGIRTLELRQDKVDAEGPRFYVQLNGVPVFCKGSNMIPVHYFPGQERDSIYQRIIREAVSTNMNMIRVWGGGYYPSDAFYTGCDEAGLLVWQDLMFACSVYPPQSDFANLVQEEVTQQVARIGHHPCIALWCGNNEVTEGWFNWGWQKQFQYSKADSAKLWKANVRLFEEVIPQAIHQQYPTAAYWPSSPSIGWGHPEALQSGDLHYWGVWWGREPFESYRRHTGRFVSEYGFQSLPSIRSLRKFIPADSMYLLSASLRSHQKHPTGFQNIEQAMADYAPVPTDLESYVLFSQWVQAEAMRVAIESHRTHKPYCMGTLFWQLNDCWPAISWSSMDYYGEPKKLHDDLKRLYATVLLSVVPEENQLSLYLVSDSLQELQGMLKLQVKSVEGKVLYEYQSEVEAAAQSSTVPWHHLLSGWKLPEDAYLYATLTSDGQVVAQSLTPINHKALLAHLETPHLTTSYEEHDGAVYLVLHNEGSLVLSLMLQGETEAIVPATRYVDLQAGEERRIKLQGAPTGTRPQVKLFSLNDALRR